MRGNRHLDDAALIARHYESFPGDTQAEQHLRACGRCTARQREIADALRDDEPAWRDGGTAAVSPERLEAQRAAILDRLSAQSRPHARVIPFAPREVRQVLPPPARAPHWRLAAAATILAMVGAAGAGWVLETQRDERLRTVAGRRSAAPVVQPESAPNQDALLSEIDMVLARPGTPELRALDALTPQGQDTAGRR